jgi:hypothetical protein
MYMDFVEVSTDNLKQPGWCQVLEPKQSNDEMVRTIVLTSCEETVKYPQ